MNRILMLSLLSSVAFGAAPAFAQSPECDKLVAYLQQNQGVALPSGLDMTGVQALQTQKNEAECTTLMQQVAQTGADSEDANTTPETQEGGAAATTEGGAAATTAEGGNITVQQAAPTITVDQATPEVSVQQTPPNVTVRQPQPMITVRQPAPVITIDIPQPEIIVQMPQPEVSVQQVQPQVTVKQAQPEVSVVQPEQPQVNVTEGAQATVALTEQGQANVQVEQTGEAQVTYERAEPQVTINQAEGQPKVTIQQMEGGAAAGAAGQLRDSEDPNATPEVQEGAGADQQAAATQSGNAAAAGQMQRVPLASLTGMNVVNERGENLGKVEGVVRSTADKKMYVQIENGGFLGIGENHIALSLEGLMMRGNDIIVPGLTDEQIRALPKFEAGDQFPAVEDPDIEIRTMAAQ